MPLNNKYSPLPQRNKPYYAGAYGDALWAGPILHPDRVRTKPKDRSGYQPTALDLMRSRLAVQKRACALAPNDRRTKTFHIKALKREMKPLWMAARLERRYLKRIRARAKVSRAA